MELIWKANLLFKICFVGLFLYHVFTSGELLVSLIYTLFFLVTTLYGVWMRSFSVLHFFTKVVFKNIFLKIHLELEYAVAVFKWPTVLSSECLYFGVHLFSSFSHSLWLLFLCIQKMIPEGSYSHLYFRMSISCQLFLFVGCLWVYFKMFYF